MSQRRKGLFMLSKEEIKQGLGEIPLERVLNTKGNLTQKQKAFVKEIVINKQSKTKAYKKVYKSKMNDRAISVNAHKLSKQANVSLEMDRIQMALDRMEYFGATNLRALVVDSLTKVLLDDGAKHSDRINASKVIGEITGVDLFKPLPQDTKVVTSKVAKDNILQEIKRLITNQSDDVVDVEALGLLEELAASTHPGAAPPIEQGTPLDDLHTIPLKSSHSTTKDLQKNDTPENLFKINELRDDSESSLPPLDDFDDNGDGEDIEETPPVMKSGGFHP